MLSHTRARSNVHALFAAWRVLCLHDPWRPWVEPILDLVRLDCCLYPPCKIPSMQHPRVRLCACLLSARCIPTEASLTVIDALSLRKRCWNASAPRIASLKRRARHASSPHPRISSKDSSLSLHHQQRGIHYHAAQKQNPPPSMSRFTNPFYGGSNANAPAPANGQAASNQGVPPPAYSRPVPAAPAAAPVTYSSLSDLTKGRAPAPPPRPAVASQSSSGQGRDAGRDSGRDSSRDSRRVPPPPSNYGVPAPMEPPRRNVPGEFAVGGGRAIWFEDDMRARGSPRTVEDLMELSIVSLRAEED